MRIAVLPLNFTFRGGAEEYSIQLYEALKEKRINIELATCVFRCVLLSTDYPITIYNERNYLKLNDFDLLIITSPLLGAWKYLDKIHTKKIYVAHDRWCLGLEKRSFNFRKLKNMMKIVFVRSRVMNDFIVNFPEYIDMCEFIRHGIDLGDAGFDISKKDNIAINTARIHRDKRQHMILDAKPKIKGQIIFFGNKISAGKYIEKLKRNKNYNQDLFTFGFNRCDKKRIYEKAKVMIDMTHFTNDGGGTQQTFLEAMKWGCVPIVPSEWEGELKNEKNIFTADNPKEIADATNYIFDDITVFKKITETNLNLLKRVYDRKIMADRYMEIFNDIL